MIVKLNIRLLALLLSFVFIQHGGLRIWEHQWFHSVNKQHTKSIPTSNSDLSKCSCIDEALTPFVKAEFILPNIFYSFHISASPNLQAEVPAIFIFFHSLRAPPFEVSLFSI